MAIDYEVEYNNRARVPEHPQIFARWTKEGADYRKEMTAKGRADLGIQYGPSPRQTIDLFLAGNRVHTLAVFIHGGYWRSLEPSQFSQVARGLNARGIDVAVPGYDLVPKVSIGDIVKQMQQACLKLWKRHGRRLMVSGHSAGGHLAACMMATDWSRFDTDAPADLVTAAYAISGIYDLAPLLHLEGNAEFKLDAAEAKRISPVFWPAPTGRTFDAVVGGDESAEFLRQSREVAEVWGSKGVVARYEALPGKNHFTVLDAMTDPDSAMVDRLHKLSLMTQRQ